MRRRPLINVPQRRVTQVGAGLDGVIGSRPEYCKPAPSYFAWGCFRYFVLVRKSRLLTRRLANDLAPALLLITLGEQGMLLCRRGEKPFHIPTVAQEVFDVSGAGDTVIATFTLAIASGASPIEAAILSNHGAGVVVGKVGTATVTPEELLGSFEG